MVQWLGLCDFSAEGWSFIPGQGTKILQAVKHSQMKKRKIYIKVENSKTELTNLWQIYTESYLILILLFLLYNTEGIFKIVIEEIVLLFF